VEAGAAQLEGSLITVGSGAMLSPKWQHVGVVLGGQSVPQSSRLLGLAQDGQGVLCRTRLAMAIRSYYEYGRADFNCYAAANSI
jgi:hypothetical protein